MLRCNRSRFITLLAVCAALPLAALAKPAVHVSYVPNFFPAQPDNKQIGPAHGGVAVDHAGNIYVSTDSDRGILVFASDGKYERNFGPTHVHGLFLQKERDGEFLYCARPDFHEVQKIKTDGTAVWQMGYPQESGIYKSGDEFHPTNVVALPDGTIFVADGYGKKWMHKYDKDRKYVKSFGGPGGMPAEEGKFNTCHGLTVDLRGPKPMLIICNRESGRVEHWDTDGNFVKTLQSGLRMPAAVIIKGDLVGIAELQGRVTVLGKDNEIVAQVGDNPNPAHRANYGLQPSEWVEGITNSPHGIAFTKSGDLVVSEWSAFGRLHLFKVKK